MFAPALRRAVLAAAVLALGACAQSGNYQYDTPPTKSEHRGDPTPGQGTLFGADGLSLFGGNKKAAPGAPIPVNSYLWRAALDTIAFMPLASADPFGGVIITDWYTSAESTSERFKMTVYILSRQLRSDGLRVAVFRQYQDANGKWVDGPVAPSTATKLEDAILTRAREMRVASVAE